MTDCGSALSVDWSQNSHVSPSWNDMPLSLKLAGVLGGVVSFVSLASVVTLMGSLTGETLPPKSRACTVKLYVVSGWRGPNVPDVSFTLCRTGLPFMYTLNQTLGPSSTDDHARDTCVGPTSVTVTVGLVGDVVSRG